MSRGSLDLVDSKAGEIGCLSACPSVWVEPREGICDLMTRARRPEGGGREGGRRAEQEGPVALHWGLFPKDVHGIVSSYVVSQAKMNECRSRPAYAQPSPGIAPAHPATICDLQALLPQLYFTLGLGSGPASLIRRREARTWTR